MKRMQLLIFIMLISMVFLSAQSISDYTYTTATNGSLAFTDATLNGNSFTNRTGYPIPYTQDFDGVTTLPSINWTGYSFGVYSTTGANGTYGISGLLDNLTPSAYAISCPIGPLPTHSVMEFDYRIANMTGYPDTGTTLGTGDSVQIQISVNGGTSYTTILTINQSNHITSNAFVKKTLNSASYAEQYILVKFLCTWGEGSYYVDFDNFAVYEVVIPEAAISPSPVHLANHVAVDSAISWDSVSNADSYDVYFGTTLPLTPNANVVSPTWSPSLMNNSTEYFWKVVPKNVAGEAINCPTWSFTTIIALPLAAENHMPGDLATDVAVTASLVWGGVANATSYDVYFGITIPSTPNANVISPSWTPFTMNYDTVYLWKIVPRNMVGAAKNCPTWIFTTIVALPLAATTPIPADFAINVPINASLAWDAVTYADSYDVYFGTSLPMTPDANVVSPNWTPPIMEYDSIYLWVVIPRNISGEALSCPTWTFTTIAHIPPAPTNLRITFNGSNIELDWDTISGADSYGIYYALEPNTPTPDWVLLDTVTTSMYIDFNPLLLHKFYKVTSIALPR